MHYGWWRSFALVGICGARLDSTVVVHLSSAAEFCERNNASGMA
jgi:hypothetical protein